MLPLICRNKRILGSAIFVLVAALQAAAAQEQTFSNSYFSFKYPSTYILQKDSTGTQVTVWADEMKAYFLQVAFVKNFKNNAASGQNDQCKGVTDQLIKDFQMLASLAPGQTATYSRLGPGRRGGRSIDISIGSATSIYINGIPTKNGLYEITAAYPSSYSLAQYNAIILYFVNNVVMSDTKLKSNEYCSQYLP